jgi:hypothetical protein
VKNISKVFCILNIAIALLCCGSNAYAIGATTPFTTYEAEAGALGGGATVVSVTSPSTTEFSSPQLEASGHAYVDLATTNQSVTWTNNTGQNITAVNIRVCIPDSAGGGGINSTIDLYVNGTLRQAVAVSSTQTWTYETASNYNGMAQSPSAGTPHIFWDEFRTFITGGAVSPGSTIMLRRDSANSAAFYYIDCIDLEAPPAALTQPPNSLSIASYGATANNSSFDNSAAIQNCVNAAQTQGKAVWIPPGTFYILSGNVIFASGIMIEGAGPWYSTIMWAAPPNTWQNSLVFQSTSVSYQNFCMDSTTVFTTDPAPGIRAFLSYGDNWTINNVWARHEMLTWGTGNNITVENSRVNNSWGDGINLNNDNGTSCNNVTITNNFCRGNGDDGIAINCSDPNAPLMTNITVTNNTTVASWWANQMAIYGGSNVTVENNLLKDSVKESGLFINSFTGNPLISANVSGNTVLRGGGFGYGFQFSGLKISTGGTNGVTVDSNDVENAMFEGIGFEGSQGSSTNITLQNNIVNAPGLAGIEINSGISGSAVIAFNLVFNVASGQSAYLNNGSGFAATVFDNSWQPSAGIVSPTAGGLYRLVCATSEMALDNGGATTAGATVTQWDPILGNTNQEWEAVSSTGGYWNLLCQTSGMNLDNGGSTTAGTNVTQWTASPGNINQNWQFADVGGGYYSLVCQKSGMNLDNGGSITHGTSAAQWFVNANNLNQYWHLEVVPQSGHYYHLICATSGMALDNGGSTTAGANVHQWTDSSGNNNQLWELVSVGGGYYNLVCQTSGMALDNGGSTTAGANVTQWTTGSGNINQNWQFVDAGGGFYNLVCQKSGMALDNGGSTSTGTNATQWTQAAGNPNQLWRLEFVR